MTEASHLRTLRVLDLVFYQRMRKEGLLPRDELARLFPNLPELIEIHSEPPTWQPCGSRTRLPSHGVQPLAHSAVGPGAVGRGLAVLSPGPLSSPRPRLLVRSHEEAAGRGPRHWGSR